MRGSTPERAAPMGTSDQRGTTLSDHTSDELPAWGPIIDASVCHRCGQPARSGYGAIIGVGTETHYAALKCGNCDGSPHIRWLPGPLAKPKRDKNPAARDYWACRQGGELICVMCGIRESETRADMHIHHARRIEDGGAAHAVEDTVPLCADCHNIAEALRAHQRHVRGLSARNKPEAA